MTKDVERRLEEHIDGIAEDSYTYIRRPVELKYVEEFENIEKAIEREKQIKNWTRKKKEALIFANYDKLKNTLKRNGILRLQKLTNIKYHRDSLST